MKPKIEDVAKLAGVSRTTVSRVLYNRGYISNETREKVQKAMDELNYFPNDVARSLFNKRSNLIGLILPTNGWTGALTLPRQLTLGENNKILMNLLKNFYCENQSIKFVQIN